MTDKIRIVGAFGENVVNQVQSFVGGLEGVSAVSVLRDGTELYPQPEQAAQENGEPAATA
jgi:hypothetical protein